MDSSGTDAGGRQGDDSGSAGAEGTARKSEGALARARKDLLASRPDLARDRVTGFIYTLNRRGEYQEEAYDLLGQIHYAMRDLPKAGGAWLLTEKSGPEVEEAMTAFFERYGTQSVNLLKATKPRAPADLYPEAVRDRLREWGYRYLPYRPRSNPHADSEWVDQKPQKGLRPIEVGCLIGVAFLGMMVLMYLIRMFAS